jgi:large subunit ribosomal protein L9
MKVILLKDVPKVGRKYDIKNVADGYALNMLIPRGMAQVATPAAVEKIEKVKANDMTERRIQEELLVKNLEILKKTTITLTEKANEKGNLFAGVTKEMLVSEIEKSTRLQLNPEFIKLDKPLKEVGVHTIIVEAMGKKAEFTVEIQAE